MFCEYDLHSHSTASDGTLSPGDLVNRAANAGVRVLALTDHDTTAGIEEALSAASSCGLVLIPGVEISVTWNKHTVHIVGLNVDHDNRALQLGLRELRRFRDWRAKGIAERLEKAGIAGAYEGALAHSNGTLVSRTHFARYLVEQGLASDERRVFKHYLVKGKPGFVAGQWAELAQAVEWIHDAGGVAVVAHPARYKMTRSKLRRLFSEFAELGGEAIEVVSGSHSRDDYFTMAKHAGDFGLQASAGSDFHSPDNPWIEFGQLPLLPDICRPIWSDWMIETATSNIRKAV
ncbi:MAG: PHP domain-containing protein [Candidatus Thiodiazotropha endolucinida]